MKKYDKGILTSVYLVWYGLGRIYIESLRTDSLMLGNIKIAQLISVLFIISGICMFLFMFIKEYKNNKKEFY